MKDVIIYSRLADAEATLHAIGDFNIHSYCALSSILALVKSFNLHLIKSKNNETNKPVNQTFLLAKESRDNVVPFLYLLCVSVVATCKSILH